MLIPTLPRCPSTPSLPLAFSTCAIDVDNYNARWVKVWRDWIRDSFLIRIGLSREKFSSPVNLDNRFHRFS